MIQMNDKENGSSFIGKVINRLDTTDSHLCVGLDTQHEHIPAFIKEGLTVPEAILAFNKRVIDLTNDICVAYKINIAFYLSQGQAGFEALERTNSYLLNRYPDIPIFADYKVSEMGDANEALKRELFDLLHFDCIMVTPWFGFDTITSFLEDRGKGVIVYVHDSNPSATDLQDLELKDGRRIYEVVAEKVSNQWNKNGNVFVEAGATYPKQLRRVRQIVGEDMPILTAGIGNQGGKVEDLVGVFGKESKRLIVNSSRGIIYAGKHKPTETYFQFVRQAAQKLRQELKSVADKS